eukprot:1193153-Prorocentrum_minimum.AAC.3
MRGRVVVVIGDSVTTQWLDAVGCEAARVGGFVSSDAVRTLSPPLAALLKAEACSTPIGVAQAGAVEPYQRHPIIDYRFVSSSGSRCLFLRVPEDRNRSIKKMNQ